MSTATPRPVPLYRWPAEAIWEAVAPLLPGFTVEVLPRIDSTNTELMRRARAGRCEPTLLVAEQQTAGRGRLGRSWHSAGTHAAQQEGASLPSLTFSLGLPLAPANWSGLSLAVGVSVAESLQPVLPETGSRTPRTGSRTPRIGLKWPNDLWLEDSSTGAHHKLGGILVETASVVGAMPSPFTATAHAALRYVVVGVGLNVQTPVLDGAVSPLSVPPGSLQELTAGGESEMLLDAPAALLRVAAPLVAMLQAFEGYGFAPMQPRFAARDVLQGRAVTLSDGTAGMAHGVGDDGALLVHTAGGMQAITSSEISVRPSAVAPM